MVTQDDSRERPESAVTDDRPAAAHDDPMEPSHSSAIAQTIVRTGQVQAQNPKQDDDDEDDGINPSGYGGEC